MRRLTVLLTLLVSLLAAACWAPGARAADRIYFTTPYSAAPKIFGANLDGSSVAHEPVVTGAGTVGQPFGLAVDTKTNRLYWGAYTGNKIGFTNLDGSGGGDLVTGAATVAGPSGVLVDQAAGSIYWANGTGNKIS